jgi:alpha-beta hydrolase superfamily lysophospholipase
MTILAPPSASTLTTADGFTLTSRSWVHPDPRALVVLVHGFAASADDPAVVRQAEALHGAGFGVLTYDSRGHGDSDGLCTIGDLESQDVAAAVEAARASVEGPEGAGSDVPVIVLGASMGAIAALRYAAATDEPPAGLVCVSSPSRWRPPRTARGILAAAMTRTGFGRFMAARYLRVRIHPEWGNPEPPHVLMGRIQVPIAIVHGDRDRFILPSEAVELYHACQSPRRLAVVPDMGHAFDRAGVDPIRAAVEWLLSVGTPDEQRSRRSHRRFILHQ